MATIARQIMSTNPECPQASGTVLEAAKQMARLGVGALPICGDDNRLKGMIIDRDTVVKVLAGGKNPENVQADEILATMTEHQVRRLPVIDGRDLVGIVAQADVARALDDPSAGDLLETLSVDY